MRRLVIAIDCDDVLINATEFLVENYNRIYGTQVKLAHAHDSRNDEWQAERPEVFRRMYEIQRSSEYGSIEPTVMTRKAIEQLASHHELHVVSARSREILDVTQAMLEKYFRGSFKSIEHVGDDRSKGEVCESLGAHVMVDDNGKHLIDAREHGVENCIWFGNYPWQQGDEIDLAATRCLDWHEAQGVIEGLARG